MARLYDLVRRVDNSLENMPVIAADNVAEYIYGKYGVYEEAWKEAPCLAPVLNPLWIETKKPSNAPSQLPEHWGCKLAWAEGNTDVFGTFMYFCDRFNIPQ